MRRSGELTEESAMLIFRDFEYLDTLSVDTERKIKLGANMRRWTSPFNELSD